jgi:septal ring-binding cell division protein DamX
MSSTGITARQLLNNPVVTRDTVVVQIPASAADDLRRAVQTALEAIVTVPAGQYAAGPSPTNLLLSNNGVTPVFIDSAPHAAGEGLVLPPNGSLQLPWAEEPATGGALQYEAQNPFYVMIFF